MMSQMAETGFLLFPLFLNNQGKPDSRKKEYKPK